MRICFSIMPFDGFDDIDSIVEDAARSCGLEYVRGDRRRQSGSVLPQIVSDIKRADVVVVDISGHNPNVFYELGIAHQLRGAERVVIITQKVDGKTAYDIHEFRQVSYEHTERGRKILRDRLPAFLREAAESRSDEETWSVIRGHLPRTRVICRDLQRLVADSPVSLAGTTIRIVAGLGSLAISDRELADPELEPEYVHALLAERDALRTALLRGATLKAVLNPPRRFTLAMQPQRQRMRFQRLIGLLQGESDSLTNEGKQADTVVLSQCSFALSAVPMPNLLIIGNEIAYEGMKRGGSGGFARTHCDRNPASVREQIDYFDRLFTDSRREMERSHPPDGRLLSQLREFYSEAAAAYSG